ncbi:MAG: GYD domain-containing protein [Thaumarchaeota archaeon]|nr:GYD domain-containing protein [Nitrososphaerota archaeon]
MPYFITLGNWTDQGIRNVKDVPKRVAAAKKAVQKAGGKWHGLYFTFGKYDFIVLAEFPDDQAAYSFLVSTGSLGNVRTTTLKAFTEAEGFKIIGKLR